MFYAGDALDHGAVTFDPVVVFLTVYHWVLQGEETWLGPGAI